MKRLPHISTFKVIANRKRIQKNPLPFHHENFEKLGDTFCVSIPAEGKVIFSRDPELVKQVLKKKHRFYSKSKLQIQDLAKYIGNGLLTSEGDHWRTHRRMIQPAFHMKKLKGLFVIMQNAVKKELDRIVPSTNQDAFSLMGDLAFQVVAKSLFSNNDIRQPMAELKQITQENQEMLVKEMRQPYLKWWFALSGEIAKHLNRGNKARDIINDLVEERLSSAKNESDLLDMLLSTTYEDGTHMPRRQLIDEVMILFTAGHETTANALAFTLYFIAKDRDLQEKLFAEIGLLNKEGYDLEDLGKLPLTASCIKEAMRLYPPAYFIDRVALEAHDLTGLELKENTMILLSLYELHRHPKFWKDPEKYIADRFVGLDTKEYNSYYYPFGAGPRMCIGNAFATYEMIIAVVEIIKKYNLSTKMEKVDINPMITLKPKEVFINFDPR
ncbi:cytochrome P450 [Flagellimonas sp. S3867]|uniref:cytochrome P450 n=1 Tax=Flagellimonas sp. S3867 TaxID=2768063 RepID=UPI0016878B3E|nr:cytochrome P450 [Flagellimonas sp. S3867]